MLEGQLSQLSSEVERFFDDARGRARRELSDQLNQSVRRLRQAGSLDQLTATLLDAAAPLAVGAAIFRIAGAAARGERIRGASQEAGQAFGSLDIPLSSAPALAGAVESRDPVTAITTPAEVSPQLVALAAHPADGRAFIFPLVVKDRVPAVLYCWGPAQGPALEMLAQVAGALWGSLAAPEAPRLVTIATVAAGEGQELLLAAAALAEPAAATAASAPTASPAAATEAMSTEATAALAAIAPTASPAATTEAPSTEATALSAIAPTVPTGATTEAALPKETPSSPATPPAATASASPGREPISAETVSAWDALSADEQALLLRALRFARVRVAEMRLFEGAAVESGRTGRDLYRALRPRIDDARVTFRQSYLAFCPNMADYLHMEMVRTLAHDDPELLGKDYPGPLV
jgi:hypothetical protein